MSTVAAAPIFATPRLRPILHARFALEGEVGRRLAALTEQWLLPMPLANPAILEMFRHRDRQPYLRMVPWAGEFAGKYLTHAVQILRLTGDERLRRHLTWFVGELTSLQAEDGYLGPWPREWRLRPGAPNVDVPGDGLTWDAWGHYHALVGLLLWHEATGDERALRCGRGIGDLLCARFLDTNETLHATGEHDKNLAPIHGLLLLYQAIPEARYLELARRIENEWEWPPAGDYFRQALAGREFWETPKPRWESLHPIMALPELFYLTGDDDYRRAFEHLWWSMLRGDRHNNGGFSSGEQATGDPYKTDAIETCCTIAWMAMSVEMLRLTGNSLVADELELSMLNSGLGFISPSGRWVTYNTPMDGERQASAHSIVFQARAAGSELNCCAVNGPRALGLLCEWAIMQTDDGVAVNFYGSGSMSVELAGGSVLTLRQRTSYPCEDSIEIDLELDAPHHFALLLRIPHWSHQTQVRANGEAIGAVTAGEYLRLVRDWRSGDTLSLQFDFRPHFWVQPTPSPEADRHHLTSIYRGPLLLTFDPRFNEVGVSDCPILNAATIQFERTVVDSWLPPQLLLETRADNGQMIRLCAFADAGWDGQAYRSWLPVRFPTIPPCEFTSDNPLRSFRVSPIAS